MPPPLASLIFSVFIFWLLRRDAKEQGKFSPGLWIPFIWVLINASRPVVYWFASGDASAEAEDVSEGNSVDRNIYLFLTFAGIVVLFRRKVDWAAVHRDCRWLYILYIYYLFSTTWSDFPFVAFKRWFKDAGDLVMILLVVTDKSPIHALRGIFVRCAYILIPLSVLFIKWYPALGRYTHRWTYTTAYSGITTNKNSLGLLAMLSAFVLVWQLVEIYPKLRLTRSFKTIWPELAVIGMCAWILSIAQSATALACCVFGIGVYFLSRSKWFKTHLSIIFLFSFAVATVMILFTISHDFRAVLAGMIGRDVTLTERTIIWEESLKLGTNPVIGSGFASTWISPGAAAFVDEFHLSHAHNGYLETYLHTGWIGVLLLSITLVIGGRNAFRQLMDGRLGGSLFVTILFSGLLYNYTEVAFSRSNVLGLLMMTMTAFGLSAYAARGRGNFPSGESPSKHSSRGRMTYAGERST